MVSRNAVASLSIALASLLPAGCASGAAGEDAGPGWVDAVAPEAVHADGTWLADATLPPPLPDLPDHDFADQDGFETHDACQRCHTAAADSTANRDEDGRDVSPDSLWRASMMAMSGRDPYWLAVFSHEVEDHPRTATATIEHTCTRCHAPAANAARSPSDPISLSDITGSVAGDADLARDGATCSLCHQIGETGLGTPESFTGGFVIDEGMRIYGPHEDPMAANMATATGYQATHGPHVLRSAACATCHTVITRALDERGAPAGPPFPEQVPYLEWRNSAYTDEGGSPGERAASCQDCHVPTQSVDGEPLETALSTRPVDLPPRRPIGRHTFVGGNAYMLDLFAANVSWLGADVTAEELTASSDDTEANLRGAASLALEVRVADGVLGAAVTIENHAGHRFPTSYPSRRAFVRLTVEDDAGEVLWRSGRTDEVGGLIDADGARLDYPGSLLPHYTVITAEEQVQVYEGVMGDAAGAVTHGLLRATRYLKDNRLLPLGWSPDHPDAAMTSPVGAEDDDDFVPGADEIRYQIELPPGAARVRAELVYQAVPPAAVEHLYDQPTAEIARFDEMRRAQPDRGRVVASATEDL